MTLFQPSIAMTREKAAYGTAGLLLLFSFLLFHIFSIPVPLNVDTYLYARAIETFEGPAIHFGYYIIGSICHCLLGPLGVTPLQTLGYISQFFGSVSVSAIYIFTFMLTGSRLHSFLTACILMFSGAFWCFSIHGEVYVPQLAFVLLSLILLMKTRPMLSSISILIAVSITPTSLLALVPLSYIMCMKKFDRKHLMYFAAPILLAYVILMSWEGPRVIETFANAMYSPKVFVEEFSYMKIMTLLVYQLIRAYGNSFDLISLFAIFGFTVLYTQDKKLWGLMLAFMLPFLAYFYNLGLFSADHLIISFIAVSILGAYGILKLLDMVHVHYKTRFLCITLLLCFHIWITYERSISRQMTYSKELNRVVDVLSEKYCHDGIMLSDFDFGVAFFFMSGENGQYSIFKGNPNAFLMENSSGAKDALETLQGKFWLEFAHLPDFASRPEFKSLVDERPIYFVDTKFWPIGLIQVYMALKNIMGIEKQEKETGRLKNIREYLAYKLDADITLEKIIDSPLHPVYLMRDSHWQNNLGQNNYYK
ncbi:MAG: hypothetical protein U9N82_00890 [Thermodesulfobacteriota bacterium]|nr:hypothetical protein [Thermodesulfobacteriota bacterium]